MAGRRTPVPVARRPISRCERTDAFCSCWTPAHTISASPEFERTANCNRSPPLVACRRAPTDSPLGNHTAYSRRLGTLMKARLPRFHQGDTVAADDDVLGDGDYVRGLRGAGGRPGAI